MIKTIINAALGKFGYEIRKMQDSRGFYASYLTRLCVPKTVFDVGVGYGTYELYKAFPSAKFILIEPLKEYQEAINDIKKKYNCEVYYKALSDREGKTVINVDKADFQKSSIKDRAVLTKTNNPIEKREIEVTTLDAILKENQNIEKPILLKIDTEGNELAVLKGAKKFLQIAEYVISEVSVAKRFENSYTFEDLIHFMKKERYSIFSLLNVRYVEEKLETIYADIIFKKM